MAEPLQHVSPGQPITASARTENLKRNAARYVRDRAQAGGDADIAALARNTTIVTVKNTTATDLPALSVLGISGAQFTPTENDALFKSRVLLKGTTPTKDAHAGKFVVLLDPIRAGELGRAYIDGACPARVNILGTDDQWADVAETSTAHLESGGSGSARILWHEPGTGEKLAYVQLGEGGGAIPAPQYQGEVLQGVAANTPGYGYVIAIATVPT